MNEILFLFKTPDFTVFIKQFGYIGIYVWFISFDQLTPLPEEFSLLVLGYLVGYHVFEPVLAGVAALSGFLTIDIIYYQLSKHGSKLLGKNKRKTESGFLHSYNEKLKNNMAKTLLILCFIPRIRLWAPIMVGAMKLPFGKFLFYNTIGLTVFTALYLTLGIIFRRSLSSLFSEMKVLQDVIFFGSLVVIGVITFIILRKKKQHGK